ncbi:DNA recombination protein RmuC [Hoyosella rhizosphaerae]|nr:DNA recombination protein RmuC [Hoyosella rhizosphaerae]MBN4925650.1 DNA recombination protein RmuC [Hoyosella rhizosphaerae]
MNALTFVMVLIALFLGGLIGWLLSTSRNGTRVAYAEAKLQAIKDSERLLRDSLNAANEDSAKRQSGLLTEQVSHVVAPLRDAVGTLAEHVHQVEKSRISAYAGLIEQVSGMQQISHTLNTHTGQLVQALRAPQVRGRWGEIQLQRVVEIAGMREHCDFSTQAHASHDGENEPRSVRPDLVVRLAGGKNIVVDAKAPLSAYLEALEADNDADQTALLRKHASQLKTHILQLSSKSYWNAFATTPEFVVLFIPGDPFLDGAMSADPDLLELAFSKNVILATPTTLVALLRTIAHTWKQEALSRDAAKIHQLGRDLYSRLGVLATHMDRLGGQLGKSVDAFNSTVSSMESRVLVTARKLHELPAFDSEPPSVNTVDTLPRGVSDPEIYLTQAGSREVN